MTDLSGFIEFPPERWTEHVRRVISPSRVYEGKRPRLLKVPLLMLHKGTVLLTDMTKAPASTRQEEEKSSACLTVPFRWLDPAKMLTTIHFRNVLEQEVHGRRGIVEANTPHTAGALGLYKDYPSDHIDKPTAVTVLPFIFNYTGEKQPKLQQDYKRFRGRSEWVLLTDAVASLTGQSVDMPDNKLAHDAEAIVNYHINTLGTG